MLELSDLRCRVKTRGVRGGWTRQSLAGGSKAGRDGSNSPSEVHQDTPGHHPTGRTVNSQTCTKELRNALRVRVDRSS